jgi:hypothetical protein
MILCIVIQMMEQYQCRQCGQECGAALKLFHHKASTHGTSYWSCPWCSHISTNPVEMIRRHVNKRHPGVSATVENLRLLTCDELQQRAEASTQVIPSARDSIPRPGPMPQKDIQQRGKKRARTHSTPQLCMDGSGDRSAGWAGTPAAPRPTAQTLNQSRPVTRTPLSRAVAPQHRANSYLPPVRSSVGPPELPTCTAPPQVRTGMVTTATQTTQTTQTTQDLSHTEWWEQEVTLLHQHTVETVYHPDGTKSVRHTSRWYAPRLQCCTEAVPEVPPPTPGRVVPTADRLQTPAKPSTSRLQPHAESPASLVGAASPSPSIQSEPEWNGAQCSVSLPRTPGRSPPSLTATPPSGPSSPASSPVKPHKYRRIVRALEYTSDEERP